MADWQLWIDTGGTFTDAIGIDPTGKVHKAKVLSSSGLRGEIIEVVSANRLHIRQDWGAPSDFIKGFGFRLLNNFGPATVVESFDAQNSILTLKEPFKKTETEKLAGLAFEVQSDEEPPLLAARLLTGTLSDAPLPAIEMRLATTKGTNALLERSGAPVIFIVTKGYKDLLLIGNQTRSELFALNVRKNPPLYKNVIEVEERLDANGKVIQPLDLEALDQPLSQLKQAGNYSVAVCLMHSYKNPEYEQQLSHWLADKGFGHRSVSSGLSPMIKILSRAQTTLVNAYLQPVLEQYLDAVRKTVRKGSLHIMTSAGGLVHADAFHPKDSLLSGPAGGVVGAAAIGKQAGFKQVISFDMGGTSTDVARYEDAFDYVFEHQVGDALLHAPALSIETVAAGGGSVCTFDGQKLTVGPESAGASPGPACYGAGGPLTVTDVNLLMGKLEAGNFGIPITKEAAEQKLQAILTAVRNEHKKAISREEVLEGFLQIANERMADAIRKISMRKGYDPANYALVTFGGAGAQHACGIASELNIQTILVPTDAGLLSAYGLGHAAIEQFAERQMLSPLGEVENPDAVIKELEAEAVEKLRHDHHYSGPVAIRRKLAFMRLQGQDSTIEISYSDKLGDAFKEAYEKRYGHWIKGRTIEVESFRVVASAENESFSETSELLVSGRPPCLYQKKMQCNHRQWDTPVLDRRQIKPGHRITGPALILDPYSTVVVEPGWTAFADENQCLHITADEQSASKEMAAAQHAVALELYTNRFTAIAGEMGEMLKRTALSVNIKERMDFSCALLNADGELIVNAPHIPVHLGALGLCIRKLKESIEMRPGDVVVTNHPAFGGSHLPDITVVTPVYTSENKLLGYAASRAHHAEIGGVRPGSMPPNAASLAEEGVIIPPSYLIRNGKEQWEHIRNLLKDAPYPSRSINENIADLQAAVAANLRGKQSLLNLVQRTHSDEVLHYMKAIKQHATEKAQTMLAALPDGSYSSKELLDDGTPLNVQIEKAGSSMIIDFEGTAAVHPGNLNATPAIVNSVVMYVLRLLINEPLPLNDGLLEPVTIRLPECLLNPPFPEDPAQCPAVVGGNTEISQRLVDLLLKPFEKAACSQGTMNNVLFGNDYFGYYETVGGGTGAGPDFDGADAVHHHMTNTAGTDPEILEHRYPVRLGRYAIREGSGGEGTFKGGNGIIRELTFLEPVSLSVLTQHRKEEPYGIRGGKNGAAGSQWVIRKDGTEERLAPVDGRELQAGDRFILHTPGGGGYGAKENGKT